MKRLFPILLIAALMAVGLLVLGLFALLHLPEWRINARASVDPYADHFTSPLPPTAKLLHYEANPAGFDISYAFVFETADDQLLNEVVQEWRLEPVGENNRELPISFIALEPPPWWHTQEALAKVPLRYAWVDRGRERYRSVWFDREKGLLYAEYGNW